MPSSAVLAVYALALVLVPVDVNSGIPAATHATLADGVAGAVEVETGVYHSHVFGAGCPFRVFAPAHPTWVAAEVYTQHGHVGVGLRLVVYVMHLDTGAHTDGPQSADDGRILNELIAANYLIATVDFGGRQLSAGKDRHVLLQKDINGLFCAFGG